MLALKSSVLLGAALGLSFLLRRKSAAVRHLILSLAFTGVLVLPLLSALLPVMRVPVGEGSALSELIFRTEVWGGPGAGAEGARVVPTSARAPMDWRLVWMLLGVGGASVSLGRMVAGWAAMERMRARAGIFAAPMEGVELLEGAPGSMPMAYGWFRPVIFLPAEARGWSAERFRMVIQHEMAHVKRSDGGTHVLARVALSFYWWNPLAWWAWREFLQEQERAADDFVLARGALGSQYAEHLLEIARSLRMAANGRPVVAMASRSSLENRLAAILDSQRDRSVPRRVSAMATAVVAVGLVIPLAAVRAGQEEGQVTAGDEARDQGKWKTAKLEYEKFLKKQSRGPEAAIAYIHLGTVEMQDKNFGAAVKDFEKAQSADGEHRSEALMWEALAQQYVGDMGEAARLFEAALTAADPQAAGTATEMEVYARFLDEQGQTEKAKGMRAQAAQIRKQSQTVPVSRAAPSEGVFRAGGEVSSPILLSKVEPQYSLEARMAKYSGMVRLSVVIGTDGKPRDIRVSSPLGLGLDQKAIEAVSQWRFKPGVRNGEPVNVRANIEVRFRLL